MARARKRVRATRRAADGSAFQNCDTCGESVAIALADMHECEEPKKEVKRFRGFCGVLKSNYVGEESAADQPRSAFCFFMESFLRNREGVHSIDVEREGFETWKNMSVEERQPYIIQERKIDSVYREALLREINDASEMEDEADSAMVGKFDLVREFSYANLRTELLFFPKHVPLQHPLRNQSQFYEDYEDGGNDDDDDDSGCFEAFPSFDTYEWRMVRSWVVKKGEAEG
ncbi:uncharacterized protein LOC104454451 isoform X1 [Eucalyptus grandis]|uniref:uncharacterized protein LOC104454451 isoform X1 n=1 Tax=Eucalyptus grandis TaxID=71139 RepID=UPI00192ECED1|nr:uncharacterized protein LOC104454451 isoform X1 [Eucalyptus grandis]